jgi:GH25 family lysozyme M1 (1,4-beta-N-acetylmuramidase)
MLVKLAITPARIRPGSGWPARILAGILLVALAASVSPAPASAASPAPVPTPTVAHSRSGAKANVAVAPLEGLDVSRWQNTINWAQVKAAGKQFVVMKATEGTGYVDPMYSTNRAGAMGVGIPMAAYHFASPDTSANEAVLEADHYVAVAGLTAGNLLPALDLEQTGGLTPALLQVWVRKWLDEVTAKLGIRPMIYVSPNFWTSKMANNTSIAAAGYTSLWIANWGVTSPTVPAGNWNGNGYTFWQYTDCGHVAGITTGCVDLDRYNGSDLTAVTYNPTFSVVAAPPSQSIMRGATTTFAITINRSEFVPPVTLSLTSPLPSGTTYSFSTNPVTGSTSTLTITTSNVPAVTPPGVITPTIQGVGGGLTRTTVANLTVLPALPDPPTAPIATALDASAFVTWTPPANDGGGSISSYAVTAAPGGKACTATGAVSCIVTGLANGTAYTFTVTARNSSGSGPASAAAAPVTPVQSIPGATYFALTPTRLVDTRSKLGLIHGALKAGGLNTFQVTGLGTDPIPAGAIAVTGNLTVTGQTAAGYFALTAVATKTPKTSTINFPTGDTRANGVTIQLGPAGTLGLTYIAKAGATAQAIFDVTGYFLPPPG